MRDAVVANGEYYRAILDLYNGPGGPARYADRDTATAMRRLYSKAYAILYARTPKGRARGRSRDASKRIKPRPRTGVGGFYTRMLSADSVVCFYCERPLQTHERVGDHFVPLSKGGEHAEHNLVIACAPCNGEKSDQMPGDFIASRYLG